MAKILVADDDDDIRKLLRRLLQAEGYVVVEAADGEEALKQARAEHPDLIILDLNLPKMDGFDVCAQIKKDPSVNKTPVLMLTAAYDKVEHAERGLSLGADEYVVKPFLREVLLHNLRRMLGQQD
jgi:DNA-binding response OmpR family regulator